MDIIRKNNLPKMQSLSFADVFQQGNNNIEIDNKKLKVSKFNIIHPINEKMVIFNTASEAIVSLTDKEYNIYNGFVNNGYKLEYDAILQELAQQGILISESEDEELVLEVIRQRQIKDTGNELKIAINTTSNCNARCEYCFECGAVREKMSDSVVDDVIQYICKIVKKTDVIAYRWFGGEPLLAIDVIDKIVDSVNNFFNNEINYKSVIFSNGSIFNDNILEKVINKFHTYEYHLTIDGKQEEHNRKKNFLDKNLDGYTKTIETIKKLLEYDIRVLCRINIDKRNINELEEIVSQFGKYNGNKNLIVYVAPILKHTKQCEEYCFDYSEYSEIFDKAYKILFDNNLLNCIDELVPKRRINCCSTRAANELVVDTRGTLFKCMQTATKDQYSVGNCRTGLEYNAELAKWITPSTPKECINCVFMPICQGGCKGFRSLNNPLVSPCTIEKHFIDVILKYANKIYEREARA